MIQEELLNLIRDSTCVGERLNEIVDQFRAGRDVLDLVNLLDSNNTELVSIGAWILSELQFHIYNLLVVMQEVTEVIQEDEH